MHIRFSFEFNEKKSQKFKTIELALQHSEVRMSEIMRQETLYPNKTIKGTSIAHRCCKRSLSLTLTAPLRWISAGDLLERDGTGRRAEDREAPLILLASL